MHAMAKMAKLAKNRQLLAIEIGCQKWPLGGWRFWRNWRFCQNRHACNGETGKKSPASGDLNWMPKVAPWRLAILAKMAILAKLAILAKIARGLAIYGKIFKLDAKSGPFKVDN